MSLVVKNILFSVVVPGSTGVAVPLLIVWTADGFPTRPFAPGALLLVVGAAIYSWCVYDFCVHGRGTPLPADPPQQLVVTGMYRYTRNPMYTGVLTTILGWAIFCRSPSLILYWVVLALIFQLFVVLYEEPKLQRLFGAEYDRYRSHVNRWLPIRWGNHRA